MTYEEAKDIILVAIAEVEWNYPLEYAVAFEEAAAALDKQIPEKPVVLNSGGSKHFFCIVCDKRIVSVIDGQLCAGRKSRFCPDCGQALDWSDDNGEA